MTMQRYLVTGATGFVGRALAMALRRRGDSVLALTRREDPELAAAGVEQVRGELGGDMSALSRALSGVHGCFHVAAKVGMWGKLADFRRTNVEGTRDLVELCKVAGVKRFVYTSSPSVIANGCDLRNVDETIPYPDHYEAYYPQTKAEAERIVLSANNPGIFSTLALRPHLIFGPGDTNLLPTIVKKGRTGRLKRIGAGSNLADFSYIEDCVEAHLMADKALAENPLSAGRAYFISQGEPYPLWGFVDRVLRAHGVPEIRASVPRGVAHLAAALAEGVAAIAGREPLLTRFLVSEMATDHYFSIESARTLLGYRPKYSMEQALSLTLQGR